MSEPQWPIGRTIVAARPISPAEAELEGWDFRLEGCAVLVLDDGSTLYPSADDEGNGAGRIFGINPEGESVYVFPHLVEVEA